MKAVLGALLVTGVCVLIGSVMWGCESHRHQPLTFSR